MTPSRKTQFKHSLAGKCEQCGKRKKASLSLCSFHLKQHNLRTAALKARLLKEGKCAWCGKKNQSGYRTCDGCRARYNARRNGQELAS
jgi:hypothetical protein